MNTIPAQSIKLGVNIDHVATLRNARGENDPSLIEMAMLTQNAGADLITVHLREDRRHIQDADIFELKKNLKIPLNFEMALSEEILKIALDL
jgi:pyridoxine 5-phosphate synthase